MWTLAHDAVHVTRLEEWEYCSSVSHVESKVAATIHPYSPSTVEEQRTTCGGKEVVVASILAGSISLTTNDARVM